MRNIIHVLLSLCIASSTSFAGEVQTIKIKPLNERLAKVKLYTKPTLRSFLAVALFGKSQSEIDGVIGFAKEHKLNLDQTIDLSVEGERVFVSKNELKYNSDAKTFSYNGYTIRTSEKSLDKLVRDIFDRISPSRAAWINLLVPTADAAQSVMNRVTEAGFTALIIGAIINHFSETSFWLTAGHYLVRGGGITFIAGLILGCLWPSEAGSAELMSIQKASCDKDGFSVTTNGPKVVEIKADAKGVIRLFVNGVAPKDETTELKGDALAAAKDLLASCAQSPIPPEELKATLQSALDKKYHGEPRDSKDSQPATPAPATK